MLLVALLGVTTGSGRAGATVCRGGLHVLLLGGYLAATAVWTVQLLRRYRAPGET